jgi:hypothetical protein
MTVRCPETSLEAAGEAIREQRRGGREEAVEKRAAREASVTERERGRKDTIVNVSSLEKMERL